MRAVAHRRRLDQGGGAGRVVLIECQVRRVHAAAGSSRRSARRSWGGPQPERAPLGKRVGDDDLAVCGGVGAQAGLTVAVQHLHGHPLVRHHRDGLRIGAPVVLGKQDGEQDGEKWGREWGQAAGSMASGSAVAVTGMLATYVGSTVSSEEDSNAALMASHAALGATERNSALLWSYLS